MWRMCSSICNGSTKTHTHEKTSAEKMPAMYTNVSKKGKMKEHLFKEHALGGITCTECKVAFGNKTELKKHAERVHYPRFTCTRCTAKFFRHKELVAHEKTHTQVCTQCGKQLSTYGKLKGHRRTHDSKEFACPYEKCDFKFSTKGNLNLHVQAIHMQIMHDCMHCDKKYRHAVSLRKHVQRVHVKVEQPGITGLSPRSVFSENLHDYNTPKTLLCGRKGLLRSESLTDATMPQHIVKYRKCGTFVDDLDHVKQAVDLSSFGSSSC